MTEKKAGARRDPKTAKKKAPTRAKSRKTSGNGATKKKPGGARAGSGRKTGAATKKTREIADALAQSDEITPLEYMLSVLRETPEALKKELADGVIEEAEFVVRYKMLLDRRDWAAEKAAPYIHPRLSSIEANVGLTGQDFWAHQFASEES